MEYFVGGIMKNYVNTDNNIIKVEMKYYDNDIMNSVIYGDLDESEYETVLIHDLGKHQREKIECQLIDIEYRFTMCDASNSFESRYHMSVEAYKILVDILHPELTLDIKQ